LFFQTLVNWHSFEDPKKRREEEKDYSMPVLQQQTQRSLMFIEFSVKLILVMQMGEWDCGHSVLGPVRDGGAEVSSVDSGAYKWC